MCRPAFGARSISRTESRGERRERGPYRPNRDAIAPLPNQSLLVIFPVFHGRLIVDRRSIRIRARIADAHAHVMRRPVLLACRPWSLHRACGEPIRLRDGEQLCGRRRWNDDGEVDIQRRGYGRRVDRQRRGRDDDCFGGVSPGACARRRSLTCARGRVPVGVLRGLQLPRAELLRVLLR